MKKIILILVIILSTATNVFALSNYEDDLQLIDKEAWTVFPSYSIDWIMDKVWQDEYQDYLQYIKLPEDIDFDKWDELPAWHIYMTNFEYVVFDPFDPDMPYFDNCTPAQTPIPAPILLLGSGMVGMILFRRKVK